MVITVLNGGLGNQMFQYAIAKSIAITHNTQLYIDTTFLDHNSISSDSFTARSFELSIFPRVVGEKMISRPQSRRRLFDYLKYMMVSKLAYLFHEQRFDFDSNVLNISPPVKLEGFWQSEKYFARNERLIRQQFLFPLEKIGRANNLLIDNMQKSQNPISVHVRRGDYTSLNLHQKHGACGIEYYEEGIRRMKEMFPSAKFFFFSDDMDWVKNELVHLVKDYVLVEDNTDKNAWIDMKLMSSCKHHIIANSTFSWWGAWLNPQIDKKVIAPLRWFNDGTLQAQSKDICPHDWIRI
jgi:hypothetical protein